MGDTRKPERVAGKDQSEKPTARARTCVPLAKSRVWEEGVPSRTRAGETTRGQGRRRDRDDGSSGRAEDRAGGPGGIK